VLFLELGPLETKVSLRSRSSFDVRQVAERFGGGGHRAAAGVRFPGPLAAAESAVLDSLRAAMGESMESQESRVKSQEPEGEGKS